jgi:hypothetical protein
MDEVAAQRAFNDDYVSMKREMPVIEATKSIMDGIKVRSRYEDKAGILAQARPTMNKWGFAESFNTRTEPPFLIGICVLRHRGGFSVPTEMAVPLSSKIPGTNEAQQALGNMEYATRAALLVALGIAVDKTSQDPRMLGGTISPEQAADLERRCEAAGIDKARMLKYAKADQFSAILDSGFAKAAAFLKGFESASKAQKPKTADTGEEKNPDGTFKF